jgi:hypothetical protein
VAQGWPNPWWTCQRVAGLLPRHGGVRSPPAHGYRLLVRRLPGTSQKPQKRARERNRQDGERGLADDGPCLLRQASQRQARLALLDEAGFLRTPVVRRTRAPRGQTPILDCSDKHDRISVLSALTLRPRAPRVGLHFLLLGKDANFHGEEVVLFLPQRQEEVGGPGTIVWERNQIPSKAKVVKAWRAQHPEVVGEDCPTPAPDPNPDADGWSWTK